MDMHKRITDVFWVNANMILDYGYFGDIISMDITYYANGTNRSFALFSIFNYYGGAIIFKAILSYDKIIESFKWLFEIYILINTQS